MSRFRAITADFPLLFLLRLLYLFASAQPPRPPGAFGRLNGCNFTVFFNPYFLIRPASFIIIFTSSGALRPDSFVVMSVCLFKGIRIRPMFACVLAYESLTTHFEGNFFRVFTLLLLVIFGVSCCCCCYRWSEMSDRSNGSLSKFWTVWAPNGALGPLWAGLVRGHTGMAYKFPQVSSRNRSHLAVHKWWVINHEAFDWWLSSAILKQLGRKFLWTMVPKENFEKVSEIFQWMNNLLRGLMDFIAVRNQPEMDRRRKDNVSSDSYSCDTQDVLDVFRGRWKVGVTLFFDPWRELSIFFATMERVNKN